MVSPILWYGSIITLCILLLVIFELMRSELFPSFRRYVLIQRLPGPKGVPLLGNALELKSVPIEDLLIWIAKRLDKYDRLMRLWLLVVSNVYIKDPDDIQSLFNNTTYIDKGLEYRMIRPWLEEGLLTSTGEKWHARRKLLTPAFHFKILEDNVGIFNKCSKILCEKLIATGGNEIDLESFFTRCTLDVITGTAMGIDLDVQTDGARDYVSTLKEVSECLMARMMRPHLFHDWAFNLSTTGRRFYRAIGKLHDFSYKVIGNRKASFKVQRDSKPNRARKAFLDVMLERETEDPGSFTDKDIREEVDTFMFEGHDTTSSALVFIFFNIATYPEIQRRVYSEQCDIFGSSHRDVTVEDLNKMVYLEKVIKESLRLYPSVPAVTRLLEKDLVLNDGVVIPAKTNVITPIYLVHRNEKFWDDPEKFDPERFDDERNRTRHPYAYLPFSAGPRNCIGQRFAMMELKTVVSTVIRRLRVMPSSKRSDFKLILFLVLRTNKPVKCRFISR